MGPFLLEIADAASSNSSAIVSICESAQYAFKCAQHTNKQVDTPKPASSRAFDMAQVIPGACAMLADHATTNVRNSFDR